MFLSTHTTKMYHISLMLFLISQDHPRDKPLAVNLNLNGKDVATALVQYGMAQRGNYITDQEQQSAQIQNVLKVWCKLDMYCKLTENTRFLKKL